VQSGALRVASCSFPRMGAAAGGLAACLQGGGDRVLHVGCGGGSLTKMVASQGLRVAAVDADVAAAANRGLLCCAYGEGTAPLAAGSLRPAAGMGPFDALLVYTPDAAAGSSGSGSGGDVLTLERCLSSEALAEAASVAAPGGALCISAPSASGMGRGGQQEAEAAVAALLAAQGGWRLEACAVISEGEGTRVELTARAV